MSASKWDIVMLSSYKIVSTIIVALEEPIQYLKYIKINLDLHVTKT